MPELTFISSLYSYWLDRRKELRLNEAGYSTETVLITALLAALAIAAVAIITVKVIGKANSIATD